MSKMRFFALQELSNRKPLEVIAPSNKLSDYYGSHVFDRKKMQEYLPKEAYKAVTDAIEKGTPISREIADLIANGMKSWAKSLNVTHYTHWFQPLTDGTAEKHDGFIEFGEDGGVIERFSGKLLIQQEPDASSFPNGGIRNTFEARGYTAWDVSSPAFVVDTTLCIPTIFISYTGEALDYKTPLLKALAAVDKAATEVCQLFDKNITRVYTNLGWEQEYFLVDSSLYNARPDLCLTGRTLMGHSSAKDQQLEDHYFGSIPPRVTAFMKELEIECHKLGIPAKTRHNEVAPNQFELAPIFENCNLANDHNQLVMDLMKRIARKHHFNVLLHEKPYSGVNGSGKHNNWSLCTDTGINLFAPGKNPKGNMLFLTFLVNALMMVYKNQDLLRASIMSASNSYRLGANEAPPAILSCFLGSQLSSTLDEIVRQVGNEKMTPEEKTTLKLGIGRIPEILLDTTDRNRTSPFAFTGNRFEFRMVGSSDNIGCPNSLLNTIVAGELCEIADQMEGVSADQFDEALKKLLVSIIREHKRVIFNGNGYSDEWVAEAQRRGLPNYKSTVDCVPHYSDQKNIDLLSKFGVLSEAEIKAREEILLENYSKTINIEALTMIDMAKKKYIPVCIRYAKELCDSITVKSALEICSCVEKDLAAKVSDLTKVAYNAAEKLVVVTAEAAAKEGSNLEMAQAYRFSVIPVMDELRAAVDALEVIVPSAMWPVPAYSDIIFNV
mgnify:CR=1 FL=1